MRGGSGAKRNIECLYHEQQPGVQSAYMKNVQSLTGVLQDMGNPCLWRNHLTSGSIHQRYHGVSSWNCKKSGNH